MNSNTTTSFDFQSLLNYAGAGLGLVFWFIIIALVIATIFLPFYVVSIHTQVRAIRQILQQIRDLTAAQNRKPNIPQQPR
jgi:hypothetical protein